MSTDNRESEVYIYNLYFYPNFELLINYRAQFHLEFLVQQLRRRCHRRRQQLRLLLIRLRRVWWCVYKARIPSTWLENTVIIVSTRSVQQNSLTFPDGK